MLHIRPSLTKYQLILNVSEVTPILKAYFYLQIPHSFCKALTMAIKKRLKKRFRRLRPLVKPLQDLLDMELKDYLKDLPIPKLLIEWILSRDPVSLIVYYSSSVTKFFISCYT